MARNNKRDTEVRRLTRLCDHALISAHEGDYAAAGRRLREAAEGFEALDEPRDDFMAAYLAPATKVRK